MTIRPSGRVESVVIAHFSGHADLDRAANETELAQRTFSAKSARTTRTQRVRVAFKLTARDRGK